VEEIRFKLQEEDASRLNIEPGQLERLNKIANMVMNEGGNSDEKSHANRRLSSLLEELNIERAEFMKLMMAKQEGASTDLKAFMGQFRVVLPVRVGQTWAIQLLNSVNKLLGNVEAYTQRRSYDAIYRYMYHDMRVINKH
jgi:hypothetical protein